ncbi:hypothetical protein LA345_14995 [Burkholderia vietnamiensis]|uniref:Uncharacterized protein n=1 Tax=Burkholderia vietnamiensis (strain G4 / LMG 22486) TaxID=269482 RepID=A4JGR1_BURVG|nr:hypothetical protein [Burkholderia vietnamiensis]ABO55464.1 conserved hypothetical protein [Burkholderia vietnamiensis G4]MCB4345214.1 hypothetical protein [Burkholderia vietnamiensis]
MPKVQSLASSIGLTPEVTAALAKAQAALDAQQNVVFAVRRLHEEKARFVDVIAQSTAELTDLEKEHLLAETRAAIDPEKKQDEARLKKLVDKARDAMLAAQADLDRCERIEPALHAEAAAADTAIESARAEIKKAASAMAKDLIPVFSEQVLSAVGQLAKVVAQARAVSANLPDGFMREYLGAIKVVDPALAKIVPIAFGGWSIEGGDLLQLPADDVDTQAIAETLKPIVEMERKCRVHPKFQPPKPPAKPYEIKGSPIGGRPPLREMQGDPPVRMKTIEEALAEPYVIKGHSGGVRPWKEVHEMNMAAEISNAQQSAEQ